MSFEDPLIRLAVVLVCGIIGGEIFGKFGLPKVTGWIGTGIALRWLAGTLDASGIDISLDPESVKAFGPYMNFVLGYIAFTVGAALHLSTLQNAGKRLSLLLVFEALITPSVVVVTMYFIGNVEIQAALILAAIAIAGAPGTTVLVVQEARARGILTRTLVAAVALIDMVAVGVFAFFFAFISESNLQKEVALDTPDGANTALVESAGAAPTADAPAPSRSLWQAGLIHVALEFTKAAAVGFGSAILALALIRWVVGPAFVGPTMVAVILGSWGAATGVGASGILACTFAGIAVSNLQHDTVKSTEAYLHSIGGVLFAAFYTFAGMKLNFAQVWPNAPLVILYFLARLVGKYAGAFGAMQVAGVTKPTRNFLGLALLPHGGVAVGLVLIVQGEPSLAGIADDVTTIALAALAINQLLGPSATKASLKKVGEANQARPRLLDFLEEHRIAIGVNGETKEAVVRSLAAQLFSSASIDISQEDFVKQVMEREASESTCVGHGLMIPHAILESDSETVGVLGLSADGLPFKAPDGRPVHAVLLLATPQNERERHLEILAAFAHLITHDENLCEQLYHARSAAHAYAILHADEAAELNYFLEEAMEEFDVAETNDRSKRQVSPKQGS